MTLTEFLLARIEDDERDARSFLAPDLAPVESLPMFTDMGNRLLAECKAKRQIIRLHREGTDYDAGGNRFSTGCQECAWDSPHALPEYGQPWPCDTLRALALPYADHPDYDEACRP